ncbi:MAG TPA: TonB-dependent receptor [Crocinitomix sp.]|nr:TonB-dependent receptor [Crocinitomix sp.]
MPQFKIIFSFLLLFYTMVSFSQQYTISGSLTDASNGEDLIGARVMVEGKPGVGALTNIYGFYSLTLDKGEYTLVYQSIGYETKKVKIILDDNIVKNLELEPKSKVLNTVEVTGEKLDGNIRSAEMGVDKIKVKDVDAVPVLFGEKDILKTMQLLPGVKSAGEGNAGFYVRGGGADQNLILLDGAPVYNASHLLGFFSVFNSDALKDVKLYKGAAPAQFGGRLSSVMDIKMKEGNSKKLSVSGGLGLISSRLTVEAPIVKNKGSFIVSGRRTYVDVFLPLMKNKNVGLSKSTLYFYDLNAKANYRIGDKDRIFVSGYFGRDIFGMADQFKFDWGNATATARWNHIFSKKLFSNTSFIFSNYNYKITFGAVGSKIQIGSQIQDLNLKQDFNYYLNNKNTLNFGGNIIHHTFKPGEIDTGEDIPFVLNDISNRYSIESALYLSNEQKIKQRLTLIYGLRYSNFTQIGPGDIYSYNINGDVTDTTTYSSWEKITSYNGLSPRFSFNFMINEVSSVKASFSRTYQFLHLLSNSTASTPTDVWIPSSNNVKPQIANQYTIGYFRNFKDNLIELSTELYYKSMINSIDYRDGAEVTLNPTVESELLFGIGRAYGVEFLVKKRRGKFTGWVSYTLSKTEKQFDDINNGSWFPAKQDRTHDVSIVTIYKLNDRLTFSATWVYYTGNAVTFPAGKYMIEGEIVSYYTERNGYRMPDYHRLDLGITLYNKKYKTSIDPKSGKEIQVKKKFESSWNFSVYNAYSRENAYSITFDENKETGQTEATQLSLFKIIPSITYNFKF